MKVERAKVPLSEIHPDLESPKKDGDTWDDVKGREVPPEPSASGGTYMLLASLSPVDSHFPLPDLAPTLLCSRSPNSSGYTRPSLRCTLS